MSWIYGESAIDKSSAIYEQYKSNKVSKSFELLEKKVVEYHPSLGSLHLFSEETKNKYLPLQTDKVLNFDTNYLRSRSLAYRELTFLGSISSSKSSLHIPEQVTSEQINDFEYEIFSAIDNIKFFCPWMGDLFDKLIVEICPVISTDKGRKGWAMTDLRLIGNIFISLQPMPNNLILQSFSIAHELSHNLFMIYQIAARPFSKDIEFTTVYSGIRKTNRPIFGALLALGALGYMHHLGLQFLDQSTYFKNKEINFIKTLTNEYEKSLKLGIESFNDVKLNALGNILIRDLKSRVSL